MTETGKAKRKERADVLLVEQGLAESRTQAQALIVAGEVFVGEQRVEKPGTPMLRTSVLRLREGRCPFVSRGGIKLQGALQAFSEHGLSVAGKVVLDIGASTGGFTDCVLQLGARKVYAIDVGYGQLHTKLRADERVVSWERTNAKSLTQQMFPEPLELIVIDASFIGLGRIVPVCARLLPAGGELCALVKPQFEAGKQLVSKSKGVIRDPEIRKQIIEQVTANVQLSGFDVIAGEDCVIRGPKGNHEYFVYARRNEQIQVVEEDLDEESPSLG
jgi:23S rRNA (cytidine1920-2'-O)/16S rRNA (cytidine1409-2'-O)-methyltransferase